MLLGKLWILWDPSRTTVTRPVSLCLVLGRDGVMLQDGTSQLDLKLPLQLNIIGGTYLVALVDSKCVELIQVKKSRIILSRIMIIYHTRLLTKYWTRAGI